MKKQSAIAVVLFLATTLCLLVTQVNAQTTPQVVTDKPDYLPNETVIITGSGFIPGEYAVPVKRPNDDIVIWTGTTFESGWGNVSVTTDGTFTYNYVLDGILGTYTVRVYPKSWMGNWDDTPLAFTTFTDDRPVKFTETGLPIGTTWSVTLDSTTITSTTTKTTDTIQFTNVASGDHSFNIPPISTGTGSQLAATPSSGTVNVPSSGSGAVNVDVTFVTQYELTMATNFGTTSPSVGGEVAGMLLVRP